MTNRFAAGLGKVNALPATRAAEVKLAPAPAAKPVEAAPVEEPRVQASFRLPRADRDAGVIKARQEGEDLQKVLTRLYYAWLNS